jgi:hypothetical protein
MLLGPIEYLPCENGGAQHFPFGIHDLGLLGTLPKPLSLCPSSVFPLTR